MKRLLCAAVLLTAAGLPFVGVGCGPGYHKVECKVTFDGSPVEGATVVFLPDGDAKALQANGLTDASGTCTMKTADKDGVRPGKYKVTVSKGKGADISGGDDPNKSSTDKMKEAMDKSKAAGGSGPPGSGPPGGGPMMPGGMRPGGAGGAGGPGGPGAPMGFKQENQLPPQYADAAKTPFSFTVPVSDQPVKLDLKKQ